MSFGFGDWPTDPGDDDILTYAYQEDRILVTLDKDFGELAIVQPGSLTRRRRYPILNPLDEGDPERPHRFLLRVRIPLLLAVTEVRRKTSGTVLGAPHDVGSDKPGLAEVVLSERIG